MMAEASVPKPPRYDHALLHVVEVARAVLGEEAISTGACRFLQDAAGVFTTIVDDHLPTDLRQQLASKLIDIGSYIDSGWPVTTAQEAFDPSLTDLGAFVRLPVEISGSPITIFLLDRRIVGFDWLSTVREAIPGAPPIVTFASLKGGVGRSTALSIAAQDLSMLGLRVLAVDLDLEAPGLGSMLLPPENRPKYGTLDFFVERGASSFRATDFADLMEASPFYSFGAPVYVVPAFGSITADFPRNVLGKLARSYFEDHDDSGQVSTFLDRTRDLLAGLLSVRDFDVVLVDSRAGLHETAAASLLGIGADVLLFGVFQNQTFEGYTPLLAHMAEMTSNGTSILPRLRMIHSKADLNSSVELGAFLDRAHKMFSETLYGSPEQSADEFEAGDAQWYNLTDPDGPHYPWRIGDSPSHRLFDPAMNPNQIEASSYGDAYGDFLSSLRENILARLEQ